MFLVFLYNFVRRSIKIMIYIYLEVFCTIKEVNTHTQNKKLMLTETATPNLT